VAALQLIRSPLLRTLANAGGVLLLGVGIIGVFVPGIDGTGLLIVAAYLLARSNPRLHSWLINHPRLGPPIRDYQAGLGIPARIKVIAVVSIVAAVSMTLVTQAGDWHGLALAAFASIGVAGIWFVLSRPTRQLTSRQPAEASTS